MISQAAQLVGRFLLLIMAVGVTGCSSSPTVGSHDRVGEQAASVALQQVGTPYRYGGRSPTGFDCSGLVHYAYASAGLSIPRTTAGQWAQLTPVSDRDMRTGDLLFFNIDGKMSHVGLYIGNGRFVHAPSSGKRVTVERLDTRYYSKAFIRAGRPQ